MTLLLILLLLGMCGALLAARKGQAWAAPALTVLVVLGLIVGMVLLVGRLRAPSPAKLAMQAQAEAARALGEELVAAVEGGPVLVLNYAPAAGERLFTDARWDGLCAALTNPAYRMVAAGPQVMPGAAPAADFVLFSHERLAAEANAWLAAHPDTKAVVSLMPYPPAGLALGGRPLYAFAVPEMDGWAAGLRGGTWKAALIGKRTIVSPTGVEAADWKQLFDLVTPATFAAYQKNTAHP